MTIARWTVLTVLMLGTASCEWIIGGLAGPAVTTPAPLPFCIGRAVVVEGITYAVEHTERTASNRVVVILRQANRTQAPLTTRLLKSQVVRELADEVDRRYAGGDMKSVGGGGLDVAPGGLLDPGAAVTGQFEAAAPAGDLIFKLWFFHLGENRTVNVLYCRLGRY